MLKRKILPKDVSAGIVAKQRLCRWKFAINHLIAVGKTYQTIFSFPDAYEALLSKLFFCSAIAGDKKEVEENFHGNDAIFRFLLHHLLPIDNA